MSNMTLLSQNNFLLFTQKNTEVRLQSFLKEIEALPKRRMRFGRDKPITHREDRPLQSVYSVSFWRVFGFPNQAKTRIVELTKTTQSLTLEYGKNKVNKLTREYFVKVLYGTPDKVLQTFFFFPHKLIVGLTDLQQLALKSGLHWKLINLMLPAVPYGTLPCTSKATSFQSRNPVAAVENKFMVTKGEGYREG